MPCFRRAISRAFRRLSIFRRRHAAAAFAMLLMPMPLMPPYAAASADAAAFFRFSRQLMPRTLYSFPHSRRHDITLLIICYA